MLSALEPRYTLLSVTLALTLLCPVVIHAQPSSSLTNLLWNAWITTESSLASGHLDPVPSLAPNTTYWLILDLSPISYGGSDQRIFSEQAGPDIASRLDRLVNQRPHLFETTLRVHLAQTGFGGNATSTHSLTVYVERARVWRSHPDTNISVPLQAFTKYPKLRFAHAQIKLTTTSSEAPSLPLQIAVGERGAELAKLSFKVCVAHHKNAQKVCGRNPIKGLSDLQQVLADSQGFSISWNAWAEPFTTDSKCDSLPKFTPVTALNPGKTYTISIELSAFAYKQGLSSPVDKPLVGEVAQWLKEARPDPQLEVHVIPDADFFLGPSSLKPCILPVSLERIRKSTQTPLVEPVGGGLSYLQEHGDGAFSFGRIVFDLTVGSQEGVGTIGVSIWDKGRPLDEVTLHFCISSRSKPGTDCRDAQGIKYGLKGFDSLRIASDNSEFPDAAMHFFALDTQKHVIGLFRRNDIREQENVFWSTKRTASEFFSHLGDTQLAVFNKAREDEYLDHGEELFNFLIPPSERNARQAIMAFVRDHEFDDIPASIFARIVKPGDISPPIVPLGLVAVNKKLLGQTFRIELPLIRQNYLPAQSCPAKFVLVPDERSTEIDTAVRETLHHGGQFINWAKLASVERFKTMREFGGWLRDEKASPEATALFIVSHQGKNILSLSTSDAITSTSIARTFTSNSIVVINSCGGAKAGAHDFVSQFGRAGVGVVVATVKEVDAAMAGQYLACLSSEAEKAAQPGSTSNFSLIHFNALKCLSKKSREGEDAIGVRPWGARALAYILAGNGAVSICPPR